jgi:hypothetical protein
MQKDHKKMMGIKMNGSRNEKLVLMFGGTELHKSPLQRHIKAGVRLFPNIVSEHRSSPSDG